MGILNMSISGAAMILAIVVIRALAINKLPKKTFLALWGITLVRLLIPYSLPSVFSVYSLLGGRLNAPSAMSAPGSSLGAAQQPVTVLPALDTNPATATMIDTPSLVIDPWMVVWAVGVLVCAVFFSAAYWKCRREFRESLPVENGFAENWLTSHKLRRIIEIRQTDRISAPLTYGVFRPVILLPKRTDWEDETAVAYVLAHEYVHIRRFDAVTKLVLTAAVCVHWFNPAVWIMYVLANRDIEISCDETVVRLFGERRKSVYALTLIRLEETRSGLSPLYNHFSKNAIEERIVAIMKTKKTSKAAALAALALIVSVTAAFATTGQTAAQDDEAQSATRTGLAFENDNQEFSPERLAEYETFGLARDRSTLYWKGKVVRCFIDSVDIDGNIATVYQYWNGEGAVDIHTVRQSRQNADGSTDPFGYLIGIEEYKAGELDMDSLFSASPESTATDGTTSESVHQSGQAVSVAAGSYTVAESGDTGTEFMADIARYAPFGVSFVKSGDFGNLYWDGELVDVLADHSPDGKYMTVSSTDEGGIKIQTVYDKHGKLVGVEQILE